MRKMSTPVRRGLGHEGIRDRGRVRRVADRVAAAQQHLDGDVRQRLAHGGEPLPRVLAEEAERDVVGRAAPGLDAEQTGREPGDVRQHRDEVLGAHARREQGLVRVAERRVGDRESGLRAERGGEAGGAELEQALARSVGRRELEIDVGQLQGGVEQPLAVAVGLVDRHVGEPVQDLGAAVLRLVPAHEPRPLLDERRAQVARHEVGVVEHGLQERDVGGHAAQAELGESAAGPHDRRREVAAAAGHLDEHRVEVRADLGAGGDRAAVEPDARAARRAVGRDLAGVGPEARPPGPRW